MLYLFFFFFSSRRRHTRSLCDWSSDVCSSDLGAARPAHDGADAHPDREVGARRRRGHHVRDHGVADEPGALGEPALHALPERSLRGDPAGLLEPGTADDRGRPREPAAAAGPAAAVEGRAAGARRSAARPPERAGRDPVAPSAPCHAGSTMTPPLVGRRRILLVRACALVIVLVVTLAAVEVEIRLLVGLPRPERLPLARVIPHPELGWTMMPGDL